MSKQKNVIFEFDLTEEQTMYIQKVIKYHAPSRLFGIFGNPIDNCTRVRFAMIPCKRFKALCNDVLTRIKGLKNKKIDSCGREIQPLKFKNCVSIRTSDVIN